MFRFNRAVTEIIANPVSVNVNRLWNIATREGKNDLTVFQKCIKEHSPEACRLAAAANMS